MDTVMANQVIQLLQGLKPYLGPKGESAEKLINTLQVISSPQAQEFVQNISQLIPKKMVKKSVSEVSSNVEVLAPVETKPTETKLIQLNSLFSGNGGIILLLIIVFLFWN